MAAGSSSCAATLRVDLSDQELASRRAEAKPLVRGHLGGVLEKYQALVQPAHLGAVTHSGSVAWPYEAPAPYESI